MWPRQVIDEACVLSNCVICVTAYLAAHCESKIECVGLIYVSAYPLISTYAHVHLSLLAISFFFLAAV